MSDVWTIDRELESLAAAKAWQGTPHRNRVALMGRGIDCIRFVVEILKAAEIVDASPLPAYPIAWGIGDQVNKIAPALALMLDVERIRPDDWKPAWGDVLIWKVGKQSNHCGIVLDGQAWHVANGIPVGPVSIELTRHAFQEILRIRRPGWTVPPESVNLRAI